MDEKYYDGVIDTFIDLYEKGLIYGVSAWSTRPRCANGVER